MKFKSKLMVSVSIFLLACLCMGAGTYAVFTSSDTSGTQNFEAGYIDLKGFRNDVPIEGPMFYTEANYNTSDPTALPDGIMGTGLWKPGDTHTRGFFVQNYGSLPVKLTSVAAAKEAITNETDFNNFAQQATVTISLIKRGSYIPVGEGSPIPTLTMQSMYADAVEYFDGVYKTNLANFLNSQNFYNSNLTLAQKKQIWFDGLAFAKQALLVALFEINWEGYTVPFTVEKVYQGTLDNLTTPYAVSNADFYLNPGEGRYFGYTVSFMDLTPEENNLLQGKEVKVKFIQSWGQK